MYLNLHNFLRIFRIKKIIFVCLLLLHSFILKMVSFSRSVSKVIRMAHTRYVFTIYGNSPDVHLLRCSPQCHSYIHTFIFYTRQKRDEVIFLITVLITFSSQLSPIRKKRVPFKRIKKFLGDI